MSPDLRVHHGGRLHQDVLRVPVYFDLPSSLSPDLHERLSDSLRSQVLSGPDVLPTLFELAGHRGWAPANDRDGRSALAGTTRTLVSEDRRYLYLKDRFRFNFDGRHKNMTEEDLQRNRRLSERSSDPTEAQNLLTLETDGLASLLRSSWAQSISMPVAGRGEVDLGTLLEGSQLLGAAG